MGRISKAALAAGASVVVALGFADLPAASAAAGGGVFVIGDSLGVGMEPYLQAELGGATAVTDAEISRTSGQGLEVLSEARAAGFATLVFALGTNDGSPSDLAANLAQAYALAGGRCMVVATVSRPPLNGVSDDGLNDAIRSFAGSNPGVTLVEWEDAVRALPELLRDGVHATASGYALRAALFADAINRCGQPGAGSLGIATGGGGFGGDGIPNPDRDNLREGRTRPKPIEPKKPEPLSEDEAFEILADAVSSQIAIGAL